jgi:predicted nuclease of restriction endonuclease-like (RecB) superfamily
MDGGKDDSPGPDRAPGPPEGYPALLAGLKERIRSARLRASVAVNAELVLLYWSIGADILARQRREGWGARVIDRLAGDLRAAFPGMAGLSARNLRYMRNFAEAYPDRRIVQRVAAQLPWGHTIALLDAVKEPAEREWYARQAVEQGWSRSVLVHQIGSGLYARQGRAVTNFSRTLPAPQSDLAQQLVKDPYSFEFLSLGPEMRERDLERGLVEQLGRFFVELGKGFAFVGSQYHLEVGGRDYFLDLLFYHLRLRCFVVLDLKVEEFKPEHAGKMNFYLSAVDDRLRHADDRPSIGLILCRGRDAVVVEYALRDTRKPMGVAEYRFGPALPERLRDDLPTAAELEARMPLVSLLWLRAEIEQALRELAGAHGLAAGGLGPVALLRELARGGVAVPGGEDLARALDAMNRAAHAMPVAPEEAEAAEAAARASLAKLKGGGPL